MRYALSGPAKNLSSRSSFCAPLRHLAGYVPVVLDIRLMKFWCAHELFHQIANAAVGSGRGSGVCCTSIMIEE